MLLLSMKAKALLLSVFACFFAEVDMVTLNDYLYSGDTVLRIIQKYTSTLQAFGATKRNVILSLLISGDFTPARNISELASCP